MKRLSKILIAVSLLCLPLQASGQQTGPRRQITNLGTLINAATLAATRTATVNGNALRGYGLLLLYVDILDANDSETGVSLTCTSAYTSGGDEYRIPACVWDAVNTRYNCEAGPLFWDPSDETAADNKYQVFRVDVEGLRNATCSFAFTGGAAADTITVVGWAAVKG